MSRKVHYGRWQAVRMRDDGAGQRLLRLTGLPTSDALVQTGPTLSSPAGQVAPAQTENKQTDQAGENEVRRKEAKKGKKEKLTPSFFCFITL